MIYGLRATRIKHVKWYIVFRLCIEVRIHDFILTSRRIHNMLRRSEGLSF